MILYLRWTFVDFVMMNGHENGNKAKPPGIINNPGWLLKFLAGS